MESADPSAPIAGVPERLPTMADLDDLAAELDVVDATLADLDRPDPGVRASSDPATP